MQDRGTAVVRGQFILPGRIPRVPDQINQRKLHVKLMQKRRSPRPPYKVHLMNGKSYRVALKSSRRWPQAWIIQRCCVLAIMQSPEKKNYHFNLHFLATFLKMEKSFWIFLGFYGVEIMEIKALAFHWLRHIHLDSFLRNSSICAAQK